MKYLKLKNLLVINTFFFFFFFNIFYIFSRIRYLFFQPFFENNKFISERIIFIKSLRSFLKDLMVLIPIISLFILLVDYAKKKKI